MDKLRKEKNKNIDSNKMNLKPTYVMNNDTLRKEIEEILEKLIDEAYEVKNIYPHADGSGFAVKYKAKESVDKLLSLFTQHQERVIERLEEEKVDIRPEIKVWLTHQSREEATVHNQTLDKAISIIREEVK